jgi:hypothetical protein
MERTKFKGPGLTRRLDMKGSKRKIEKGPCICREDQENRARVKNMKRGSRTLGNWEKDRKHQMHMENMRRGLKTLGVC